MITSQIIGSIVYPFPNREMVIGTSSLELNTSNGSVNSGMSQLADSAENYQKIYPNSLDISSGVTVLRPDEAYEINRIISRIDKSEVQNSAILEKLESFLEAFRLFLVKIPSSIRRRLPLLSMTQDSDGDLIVTWATRKANAIFDLAPTWNDSFWCATSSSGDEQKSESAQLTETTLLEGISKSYNVLSLYV